MPKLSWLFVGFSQDKSLHRVIHQSGTILQRLRQMRRLDFITPRQIRNRARQFQKPIIGTRGQIVLRHRRPSDPDLHPVACKIAVSPRHAYLHRKLCLWLPHLQFGVSRQTLVSWLKKTKAT